jgi:hypothetical protein
LTEHNYAVVKHEARLSAPVFILFSGQGSHCPEKGIICKHIISSVNKGVLDGGNRVGILLIKNAKSMQPYKIGPYAEANRPAQLYEIMLHVYR